MRWIAIALLALVPAGCGGSKPKPATTTTSLAPAQSALRLAAVRIRTGNPPHLDLVELDPDGRNVRALLVTPSKSPPIRRLFTPAWSPDGAGVYLAGETGLGQGDGFTYPLSDLWRIGPDGHPELVTRTADVLAGLPSPDGASILLERSDHPARRPFTTSLWLLDANGTKQLLHGKDGQLDIPGSWSPDASTIAFTRCSAALPDAHGRVPNTCAVYTADAGGGNVKKLADRARDPAFSPDGTQIAFVSDRDQHGIIQIAEGETAYANELYVMDADGGHQKRLTTTTASESRPAWSPDGSRIAYQEQGAGSAREIRLANPEGTCSAHVAGGASQWFQEPVWRPGPVKGALPALCRN